MSISLEYEDLIRAQAEVWGDDHQIMPPIYLIHGFKRGVEIGIYLGGHAKIMLDAGLEVWMVDEWKHREDYNDPANHDQTTFDAFYEFVQKTLGWRQKAHIIRASSLEATISVPDDLDFVYIDAEHTPKAIKQDLELWYPKLRVGGIMSGHDWANGFEIEQTILDFAKAQGKPTVVLSPCQNWWFVK